MKRNFIFLFMLLSLIVSCASPTPKSPAAGVPFDFPTDTFLTPQVYIYPTDTPAETSVPLERIKFLSKFSDKEADWQIAPGSVTAAQINAEIARQGGDQVSRVEQKVINGFLRTAVKQENGQVLEVLSPAELVNGKLVEIKIKNVGQIPILGSQALLLDDYFALNFPDVVRQWEAHGATHTDFKYAAAITVLWATKFGPLRVSYMMSGKYIAEAGKYPGRLDFLRLCMFEQTVEHFTPEKRLANNLYPAPIVGLSGTTPDGITGEMTSDAFGWTPMLDFAKDESKTLNAIGQAVNGVVIESPQVLAKLQAEFDKTFMPVHCTEVLIQR